ncbi:MAG: M23 family metallopeptidase [Alistipes sp.]|nr:M23 family metallopeptidase [Alistipes sp.]
MGKSDKSQRINRSRATRLVYFSLKSLLWIGALFVYYIVFSFFFDTPTEHQMKLENQRMQAEYEAMQARYDSLAVVLENIDARDKSVFRVLFETDPYDFSSTNHSERVALHEACLTKSYDELNAELLHRITKLERAISKQQTSWNDIMEQGETLGDKCKNIPAIQPVLNDKLTLLTAGYGPTLNPFYRSLKSHQGVDYSIGEGSSVFATADGVVKEILDKNSTSGKTIVIDHGNGYKSSYSHLFETLVSVGQHVSRGDVIAKSGNSGLSLAPHLHYEVRYNDIRVNPIHFFFMELSPEDYQQIIRISQSGMQSLD